ncbi:MAG: toxin-antitoxin system YwqK family antitoxin [Bacteroidia bacterium]|nr:toxin-antitoxin system YwqK family antitoxin [Bacteroidia bacterium]
MKKYTHSFLYLTLFILLCPAFYAQQKDEQGRKQGYWKKTDEKTGKLIYEGRFKDDKPVGVFKYYNSNDSVKAIIDFKADGKTSYAKHFHFNGKLAAYGKYSDKETKDSVWTYYDEMGTLISKETYLKGKKNGESYVYLPDGTVTEIKTFKNGLEDGPFTEYYEKNKIKTKGQYVSGVREGRFIYYYPNGAEVANGFFKKDLKNGPWIYRSEDGKIKEKELYKNGVQASQKETDAFFAKNKTPEPGSVKKTSTPTNPKKTGTK